MTLLFFFFLIIFIFPNLFCSYENPADIPKDPKERKSWALSRKATIELTQ